MRPFALALSLLAFASPILAQTTADLEVLSTTAHRLVLGECLSGSSAVAGDSACVVVTFINNGPDSLFGFDPEGDYSVSLDGAQVVPPTGSPATGSGTGTLTGTTISYTITLSGLIGTETAAYLRGPALPGQNGPVRGTLPLGNLKIDVEELDDCKLADIVAGLLYVSIETTSFPAGEIRGQIVQVPSKPGQFSFSLAASKNRTRITVDIDDPTKPGLQRYRLAAASLETCFIGTVAPGETGEATLRGFAPTGAGQHAATTMIEAGGDLTDPNPNNNNQEVVLVVRAIPDVPASGMWTLALLAACLAVIGAWTWQRRTKRHASA